MPPLSIRAPDRRAAPHMPALQRNSLVWLTPEAWRTVHKQVWDASAQELLRHWQACHLPWVVARHRPEVAQPAVCLGLPAPQHWDRRRLAASVAADGIALQGQFPSLHDVAQSCPWGVGAAAWLAQGQELKAQVRVYGSYGWQFLTGMPYVRAGSDLDLSVHAHDLHAALQALDWLAQTLPVGEAGSGGRAPSARLPLRVDGEIVFPQGQALAWRELQQLRLGEVAQALVKDRYSLRLLDWPALMTLAQAPNASPSSTLGALTASAPALSAARA